MNKQNEYSETLLASRELNIVKIQECDRLINYYCNLYKNTLSSINEKREEIRLYEDIMSLKRLVRSPKFLEKMEIISDETLTSKIDLLKENIDDLNLKGDILRKKTISYKEKRLNLESEAERIELKIGTNYSQNHRLVKKIAR